METTESLYAEVKPDVAALATPLFDFSESCLKKQGNFLPHAAVLTESGEVKLVGATTGKNEANSTEILPILHDGLRTQAKQFSLRAIAVAENVTVTLQGGRQTSAVKVLLEHKNGITVALYLPFKKKLFKGYVFGNTFTTLASPEVGAWSAPN